MRKAIVVAVQVSDLGGRKAEQVKESSLSELNQHLAEGWTVQHTIPMSGVEGYRSVAIVILEKE